MSDQQVKNPEYDYTGTKAGDELRKRQKEQQEVTMPTSAEEFHKAAAIDIVKKYGIQTFLDLLRKYGDAPNDALRRDNKKWGQGHYVKNEDWIGK